MSMGAVEPKRAWKTCTECGGHGEMQVRPTFWIRCTTCGGCGSIYVGRSGEPEDYPEQEDER